MISKSVILKNDLTSYLLARSIPAAIALINFLLVLKSLNSSQFGIYVLTITSIGLATLVFFEWMRVYMLKLVAEDHESKVRRGLATRYFVFVATILLISFISFLLITLLMGFYDPAFTYFFIIGYVLFFAKSHFEIKLTMLNGTLKASKYFKQRLVRSLLHLLTCLALFVCEIDSAKWFLVALALSYILTVVIDRPQFRVNLSGGLNLKIEDLTVIWYALKFGFPVSVSLAVDWIVNSSDKYLLSAFVDLDAVGSYAAFSEVLLQMLTLVFVVPRLALYPRMVSAALKSRQLMLELCGLFGCLVLWSGLAAILASLIIPTEFGSIIWGDKFSSESVNLFRLLVFAVVLFGIKAFLIDTVFHLYERTQDLLISSAVMATLNVLLGMWLIPTLGIEGAAISSLLSFGVGMCLSLYMAIQRDAECVFAMFRSSILNSIVLIVVCASVSNLGLVGFFSFIVVAAFLLARQVHAKSHLLVTNPPTS